MIRLRPIFALFLALTLLWTQGATAALRIQHVGAMEVVLCSGAGGMQTIWLDGQGHPVAPPHDCPDCLPVLLAALPGATAMPVPPSAHGLPLPHAPADAAAPALVPVPLARGPPVLS